MTRAEENFEARWREAGADQEELAALQRAAAHEPPASAPRSLRRAIARAERARQKRLYWTVGVVCATSVAIAWTLPFLRSEGQLSESPVPLIADEARPDPRAEELRPLVPQRLEKIEEPGPLPLVEVEKTPIRSPRSALERTAKQVVERAPLEEVAPPVVAAEAQEAEPEPEPGDARIVDSELPRISPERAREIALYREGLALLRSGEGDASAKIFRDYLERYPRGALLDEAELSLIEALALAKDDLALREHALRWLEKHRAHPRRDEVRRLLENN